MKEIILDDATQKLQRRWYPSPLFEKSILTVEEAAQALRLKKGTLYNLVSKKKVPFRKRGKRLYFIASELFNWIQEGD